MNYTHFVLTVFLIKTANGKNDEWSLKSHDYSGENFPMEYMDAERIVSIVTDLNHYLRILKRTVENFARTPNDTNTNTALGLYLMKGILKRTLRDYTGKLKNYHQHTIKNVINKAEYVISHYVYMTKPYGWSDYEYRLSKLFESDESLVHSIGNLNKNRLQKWIRSSGKINDFHKEIDEASLPKEKYVELIINMDTHFKYDSDMCLTKISYVPEPIDITKLYPCRHELDCHKTLYVTPPLGFALSHRLLNIMARRQFRRCYIQSEAVDDTYMDTLCSYMYREAVYLARHGYFMRYIFIEQVGFCSMLGYKEFHRRHWFKKVSSWIDKKKYINEGRNLFINVSKIYTKADRKAYLDGILDLNSQNHPLPLLMTIVAHAVRYTTATLRKKSTTYRIPRG